MPQFCFTKGEHKKKSKTRATGKTGKGEKNCKTKENIMCVGRESNPGQLLGRQLCSPLYHQRALVFRGETFNI